MGLEVAEFLHEFACAGAGEGIVALGALAVEHPLPGALGQHGGKVAGGLVQHRAGADAHAHTHAGGGRLAFGLAADGIQRRVGLLV